MLEAVWPESSVPGQSPLLEANTTTILLGLGYFYSDASHRQLTNHDVNER